MTWEDGDKVRVSLVYERTLPSAPQNVSVTAPQGEDGTLAVSWKEPDVEGTFPIEYYLVEFRHPSGEAKKRKRSYVPSSKTSVKRTDLETGVEYRVFVQALSGDGYGEESETETVATRRAGRSRSLSVADAEATEDEDETLDFTVRLEPEAAAGKEPGRPSELRRRAKDK